jgi:esterase FrsA
MWADELGGWVFEWSKLALRYAEQGDHRMAALVYGCAKFPCLTDDARAHALHQQLAEFQLAAADFPVHFERRTVEVPYRGGVVQVPVHLYSADGELGARPVLLLSGGVDTWKMDVHPWCETFTLNAGVGVLAFDHPGTGETRIPLDGHADEVVRGIADYARGIGDGRVAHFGVSFGGNFAAMSGLAGIVDAAVDLGGPVIESFHQENLAKLPFGMHDILGNAMGWDHSPTLAELSAGLDDLSRRDLLGQQTNSAMLVINGANDVFIPRSDTLVFEGRRDTEVHLLPDSGHVAMNKAAEVVPMVVGWLRHQLPS